MKPPSGDTMGPTVRRVTLAGLATNLALAAVKAVVGTAAGSQSCVADAVHSLSDCATDVAVLVGVGFWTAPADTCHPHGHRRIETVITTIIGLTLGVAAVGLGWRAIATLGEPHAAPPGWTVFAVALLSIGTKEWLYRWTLRVATQVRSTSMAANAWHHRSDALSSIPVAAAVLVAKRWPAITTIDHVAAILVAAMLLHAAWGIIWPAVQELTDRGADLAVQGRILAIAAAVAGVREVHRLRSRRVGPGYAVDLHVLVDPTMTVRAGHEICDAVRDALLRNESRVIDVLVHLEPFERP